MSEFILIYITAPSEDEAAAIGRKLVEERLAACANVLPHMRSVYRWQEKIEEAAEAVLIVKTAARLFDDVEARVKALHSAACPCIVAIPAEKGSPEYFDWIDQSIV